MAFKEFYVCVCAQTRMYPGECEGRGSTIIFRGFLRAVTIFLWTRFLTGWEVGGLSKQASLGEQLGTIYLRITGITSVCQHAQIYGFWGCNFILVLAGTLPASQEFQIPYIVWTLTLCWVNDWKDFLPFCCLCPQLFLFLCTFFFFYFDGVLLPGAYYFLSYWNPSQKASPYAHILKCFP